MLVNEFEITPSLAPEIVPNGLDVEKHSEYLARLKAQDISKQYPCDVVIGADTSVILGDEILGKPVDRDDAFNMLSKIKNTSHYVATGVAIIEAGKTNKKVFYDATKVFCKDYTD